MIEFATGGFAVIYDQFVGTGAGGNQDHLFVQQYDANGAAIGSALELSSSTLSNLGATEYADFLDFRAALSQQGILLTGGTTEDAGAFDPTSQAGSFAAAEPHGGHDRRRPASRTSRSRCSTRRSRRIRPRRSR